MKYSIIVPVYNVEKYIEKCLISIQNQTYSYFEVIIVNDCSPDNSQMIIDKFVNEDKRFKSFIKKNGGLSSARNYGLKYVTGDYILFVDSDDYLDVNLLEELSKVSSYDMIKYKVNIVDEKYNLIRKEKKICDSKEISYNEIFGIEFAEPAWTYAYKKEFFKKYKFKFEKGRIHEDFGLIPLCIIKAKKIYYLNHYGYNYVKRKESIMTCTNMKKRMNDILFHFDDIKMKINKEKNIRQNVKKDLINFMATRVVYNLKFLSKKDKRYFINELNKRSIIDLLPEKTIKEKIKKRIFYILQNIYS